MRFALLGDHPDGLEIARALAASGRHIIATYTGPLSGAESLRRAGIQARPIRDVEEVLADPAIEAVIVAGRLSDRPSQLRRALQSERHVLCACPADETPDISYEAAMIRNDTRCVLVPLLPHGLHPAVQRLAEIIRNPDDVGEFLLLMMELYSQQSGVEHENSARRASLPVWDVLRSLGGEIIEVSAFAAGEEIVSGKPVLLTGRFEHAGIFQVCLLSGQLNHRVKLTAIGSNGQAELIFPEGLEQPARLSCRKNDEALPEETWESWDPWPALVEVFEREVHESSGPELQHGGKDSSGSRLTWQTAIRCLELDDAARRSVARRRVSTLEYPEASEEVGFKGTMTLAGCGLLWLILLLMILSSWEPRLGSFIIPALAIFLILQLFRWILPRSSTAKRSG